MRMEYSVFQYYKKKKEKINRVYVRARTHLTQFQNLKVTKQSRKNVEV